MPEALFSISAQGARDYRELARKLREAGRRDLRAKLRKQIAAAGGPVVDEVREAVRAIPVTSRGGGSKQRREFNVARATTARAKASASRRGSGLRATIASATKLQITARGVRFVVNSNQLPVDQRSLPRHLDSPKGWRHPTFGQSPWVHQQGKPYFATTIKKHAPAFRRAILQAVEEMNQELES